MALSQLAPVLPADDVMKAPGKLDSNPRVQLWARLQQSQHLLGESGAQDRGDELLWSFLSLQELGQGISKGFQHSQMGGLDAGSQGWNNALWQELPSHSLTLHDQVTQCI